MTENILLRKAISITPQELVEHEAEMKRKDKELLDQAEKIDRENAEVDAFYEKFPEVAEETRRGQDENFEKLRTNDELLKENAKRVRRETLRHTAQIAKSVKVQHGNNARAARRTGNKDNGGDSSGDGGDSDSSDPDLPWPGARAHHLYHLTHSKRNKPKYINSHSCRMSRNGTQRGRRRAA
jgi:hypothetical protein